LWTHVGAIGGDHGTSVPCAAASRGLTLELMWIDGGLELVDEPEAMRLLAGGEVGRVGLTIGALPAVIGSGRTRPIAFDGNCRRVRVPKRR
jgi:hypothetical protein